MNIIEKIFDLKNNDTSIKTELISGLTTFFTMSYLFVLSPKLLELCGLDFNSSVTTTVITVFLCSCLMAFIANKPYAVAPFIGETAFAAYTVVQTLGFSIKTLFSAIFITGIIILLMTLFNIRIYIMEKIPDTIKISFCCGLGLFFIYIALKDIGFISLLSSSHDGNLLHVFLSVVCFIFLITLIKKQVKAAIIITIFTITILGIILGDVSLPDKIISLPADISNNLCQFDFKGIFNKNFIPIFMVIFILANIDTAGGIIGLSYKDGNNISKENKSIKKAMISDSLAVIISPILGTTTSGAFLDSMTGINSGGKTGLTSLTTGLLFILGLFFTPLIIIIPSYAYSPVLLYVGILLVNSILKLDFDDISEYAPAVLTIALMIFTNNIGFGIISGFFIYPIIKLLCGQKDRTNPVLWGIFVISIIFLCIYPY